MYYDTTKLVLLQIDGTTHFSKRCRDLDDLNCVKVRRV